jgi:hypothetical protein
MPYNDRLDGQNLPALTMHACVSVSAHQLNSTKDYININAHPSKITDVINNKSINVG